MMAETQTRKPAWGDCDHSQDGDEYWNVYDFDGSLMTRECGCGLGKEQIYCENCGGLTQVG